LEIKAITTVIGINSKQRMRLTHTIFFSITFLFLTKNGCDFNPKWYRFSLIFLSVSDLQILNLF
jgi:hypothetical protein